MKVTMVGLQGLVNSVQPRLYLFTDTRRTWASNWLFDYYKQIGVFSTAATVPNNTSPPSNADQLLNLLQEPDYQSAIQGLVVIPVNGSAARYDHTINAATNAAGVEKLLIVPEPLLGCVTSRIPSKPIVRDLRDPAFQDPYYAAWWSSFNFLGAQSTDALANIYYDENELYTRDYLIAHRIHTFWWPHQNEMWTNYNSYTALIAHLETLLHHTPQNIPIIGTWQSPSGGLGEYAGVHLGGQFGKYNIPDGFEGGYSFHSGVQVSDAKFRQYRARTRPYKVYNPNKKYLAFTMIESGDSAGYMQWGLKTGQWGDPFRGTVPFSYGVSVAARDLMPGLMQYLYETATANDYFFTSMSGLGYSYPLIDYGQYGLLDANDQPIADRISILHDYYAKTGVRAREMDIDTIGMFGQVGGWKQQDVDDLASHMLPYLGPHVNKVAADMGRNDNMINSDWGPPSFYNATNQYLRVSSPYVWQSWDVGVHHSETAWYGQGPEHLSSMPNPTFQRPDSDAVTWLVDEINYQDQLDPQEVSRFKHVMAVSWSYGPRRLYAVMNQLVAAGFEFVALDELYYLWQQSLSYYGIVPSDRNPNQVAPDWCTHPGSVLLRGDVNGNNVTDEICHDSSGYWWTRGVGLSGNELSSLTGWCTGNSKLYAGEWTSDSRVDFFCYNPTAPSPQATRQVKESHGATGVYSSRSILNNSFCTHQGAWMEVALESVHPRSLACYDQNNTDWWIQYPNF